MKYIRTENGKIIDRRITFKIPTEPPTIIEAVLDYEVTMTNPPTQPYIIVKEADTIEELCDEFVVDFSEYENGIIGHHIVENTLENYEEIKRDYSSKLFKIYGAIWTSKGLIYVAKLNGNGELELI